MDDRKCKVYIASPYTVGDTAVNVKRQLDLAGLFLDIGLIPFAPLVTHFIHMANPKPYMTWMNYDFEWVKACDAFLRVPGKSTGGDMEMEVARKKDIPIFRELETLLDWCDTTGWHINGDNEIPTTLAKYDKIINKSNWII